jgi:hypothetical protein
MSDLSQLARRERARLIRQTAASGQVSNDDLGALERLEKLAAGDRSWHQWWVPACAFLLPLAIVTLLIETEQRRTQIDLDANVGAFSATLEQRQPLFDGSLLEALSATGLEGIDDLSAKGAACSANIRLAAKPDREDAINLQLLEIPKGWRVRLERSEKSIELTLADPKVGPGAVSDFPATVSLGGRATVETRCGGVRRLLESKEILTTTLRLGPQTALNLTPLEGHPLRFAREIATGKLALVSEEVSFADVPENRQLSSVLSGTVYLNALNGKPVVLRPSEALTFSGFKGTFREITPTPDGLNLKAFATVEGMRTGQFPNQRSLMPTWLEWIGARNELWLWWGSALSVFAVLMSVLRWLKFTS